MQIATSLTVVAHDACNAVERGGADAGGADIPANDSAAFGELLSHRIRAGGSKDAPQGSNGTTPPGVAEHVAADAMPTKWAPVADEVSLQAAGVGDHAAPTTDDANDDANSDLAAQLAFVAQWAALGQPADRSNVRSDAVTTGPSDVDRSPDLRAKLDAVRSLAGGGRDTGPGIVAVPPTATDAAVEQASDPGATPAAALLLRSADAAERPATAGSQLPLFADAVRAAKLGRDEFASQATPASPAGSDPATAATIQPALRDAICGAPLLADVNTGLAGVPNVALFALPTASAVLSIAGHGTGPTASQAASLGDRLHEQVGTPAWSHEVGQAALRIAATDLQSASLRLNPEHLGPLDVQVRIDQGVAHVAFHAAHADTRQALESSRATLDQLFQGQGLRTGDVSIAASSDSANAARTNAEGASADASRRDGSTARRDTTDPRGDALTANVSVRTRKALGLVDTFA